MFNYLRYTGLGKPPLRGASPMRAWVVLGIAAALAGGIQLALLHRVGLHPSDASAAAASAVMGLVNGRGLTVAADEVYAAYSTNPREDLLTLYHPAAERMPSHQPLPGFALGMASCAWFTGHLRYLWVIYAQIGLHLALALLLARELMRRSRAQAVLAGAGWMLFAPFYRLNLIPSYDAWTSFVSLGLVLALLRYSRQRTAARMILCAALAGAGLWVRDYFFVLPVLVFGILAAINRATWRHLLLFALLVCLSAGLLAYVRRPTSGVRAQITRGSSWHTFWAGVGQFRNDVGVINDDGSVRDLATRLSGGKKFDFVFFEFDPEYNRALGDLGRAYIRQHPWSLLRNALQRCVWLLFPGTMHSGKLLTTAWLKLLSGGVSVVITLLAGIGFVAEWRRSRSEALILAAPWLALFPLVAFYFIAKVPVLVFFVFLAFAGRAVADWLDQKCTRGGVRHWPNQRVPEEEGPTPARERPVGAAGTQPGGSTRHRVFHPERLRTEFRAMVVGLGGLIRVHRTHTFPRAGAR